MLPILAAAQLALTEPLDKAAVAYTQPVIAFTHAEVIDGTGAAPRRDMTLVVRDGRIAALGPSATTKPPAGAEVIDAAGKTLIPGFVMLHEHMFYPMPKGGQYEEFPYSFSRLYLAGGTTTMRTAGTMAAYGDLNTKRLIEAGRSIGPDIDVTGPYLDGPGAISVKMIPLRDPAEAARTVDYWMSEGATSFKAYMNISRAELKAAIDHAHAHGIKVTGHLCSVTFREAADLGIDNLEHAFEVATDFTSKDEDACPPGSAQSKSITDLNPDGPQATALIRHLIDRHVALTSTLTVFEQGAAGQPETPEAARALLSPQLRASYEGIWARVHASPSAQASAEKLKVSMALEKRFADMGGLLVAGTDPTGFGGVIPGFSGKRQVELLVQEGWSFPQALRISTLNGAKYLGREREVGSLEVGKRADLSVIEGDPAADPKAIERMPLVFKAGVGYRTHVIIDGLKGAIGLY